MAQGSAYNSQNKEGNIMTIEKQIAFIMRYHAAGSSDIALNLLEHMIRSAMSNKQIKEAQKAINLIKSGK